MPPATREGQRTDGPGGPGILHLPGRAEAEAALGDQAVDGLLVLALDGRILDMDRRAEELLGLPRFEVVGRSTGDVSGLGPIHRALRDASRRRILRRTQADPACRVRLDNRSDHGAGGDGGLEIAITAIASDGGPVAVAGVRSAGPPEAAPPSPTAIAAAIWQMSAEMVVAVDREGRAVAVNEAARRRLGLRLGDAWGARLHDRHDAGRRMAGEDDPIRLALDRGRHQAGEALIADAEGRRLPVAYRCAAVVESSRLTGAVLVMHDRSVERRERERGRVARLEARRQQRRALRARREFRHLAGLEKAKARFLRIASHELRSPIAVLRGYLQMLESGAFGTLPAELGAVLPLLSGKVAQMNALVDGMLEAARLDDGRLELSLKHCDLRQTVEEAVASVDDLVPSRRISLALPERPVRVRADELRLRIVITNLLHNAVKYSPDGGPIACRLNVEGGEALIRVIDQGVGIAAADVGRLFNRFERITTPATRSIPGAGLGLYLARELARLHGGDITATSELGVGSTFTVRLPLGPSAPA